ncbi:HAMP domain-containing sensor histidine kinase [Prevotella sp. E2-28]|uniref:sensor histidine kinase n=1 Tax=Prevotella sp. E2-28 TaxID=2913620 RepID=UPI001EDA1C8F|nr:HAMP domain-containing sensor histidine kinase [Prevotella sp. E2-28]UKK54511.1 HAMP domain-containing histidine kinase [Prevotella sp. E2-28]
MMAQKSELHQRAESEDAKHNVANARSLYIRAFEGYVGKGQIDEGVACGVKATALYYKDNLYKEAFELLRRVDQQIDGSNSQASNKSALHYQTSKERMQMYVKLRKSDRAKEQMGFMENHVSRSGNESLRDDLLYQKAIFYYTFGQTAQGNAVFKEMASKLTAQKDYDKVDEVYQMLLASGRQSNNAGMLNQAYSSYMVWKDSVTAIKTAEEIDSLKLQIVKNEEIIADKDDSLSARQLTISGLIVLAVILAVVLVLGAMVLMRFIVLTRTQKKTIRLANESNALKAKFISNISDQLEPTLKKLDSKQPEVRALLDFSEHIQTLSDVENSENVEMEDVHVQPLCESLIEEIKPRLADSVTLTVNVPKVEVKLNKDYITYILRHLLNNAVEFTPSDGKITLEFKKRSPKTYQFLITNTGAVIPEEKREDVFKPFLEIKDLTDGDGLGLPICKQMALKINGDLDIDSAFTKGTRFVLNLHV